MCKRWKCSCSIFEVKHFCLASLRSSSTSSPATRSHSPSLNAQISTFGLAWICFDTSFTLPVWIHSLPSKIWAVPKGLILDWSPYFLRSCWLLPEVPPCTHLFSFFIMGSVHQIMVFISCEPVDHFLDPLPVFLFLRYHPVNCCLSIFFTCF